MALDQTLTLAVIVATWFLFYFLAKRMKLEEKGWDIQPYYALYKSTKLNDVLERIANWNLGFWRVLGNIGIAAGVGQAGFLTYTLTKNLWSFFYKPEQASPVQPLIPGVTISVDSLPWFLLVAGILILTHEIGHGVMCVVEGIPVKSSAIMFAVVTFGGAVEPDEEGMGKASVMSRMRVFAIGSLINLLTGLLTILLFIAFGRVLPVQILVFLNWLYFVSINLAMMNMLPIGPLDGGQMWRTFTGSMDNGAFLQTAASYAFMSLILMNLGLSLVTFGWVPI